MKNKDTKLWIKMNNTGDFHTFFLVTVIGTILLSGCSNSPSSSDVRRVLESRIQEKASGVIKLNSIATSNGREVNAMGKKLYFLDYQAEIEFTADCYWGGRSASFEVVIGDPRQYDSHYLQGKECVQKGQQETISGSLRFELSDGGWQEEIPSQPFSILPPGDRDLTLGDLSRVAALAYQYRQQPTQMGGGGGSYLGFTLRPDFAQGVTVVSIEADRIVIEKGGVRGTVDSEGKLSTN
jgi:outer membrane murein-binding lipoprotein Lpp